MDLRQLRYFVTVAEERSITRAAVQLHLTQPPLSTQLARLERELGVPLLHRHRRGIDLTDAGQHLLAQAKRLLSDVEDTAESVRHLGEGRSGRIALAFDSATAWGVLPELLSRYRAERPAVTIEVSEETPDAAINAVRSRRAELGLVHLPPPNLGADPNPDLDLAVANREPLVAVLPAALAAQLGERVDLTTLAAHPFLVPPHGTWGGLHAHVLGGCRQAGFEPTIREVQLVPTAIALIAAGLGVSLLPASAHSLCGPTVTALPLSRHVPVVETALVRRRDDIPSPPVQHFLRLALATPEPDMLAAHLARR